jgi:hypothetical protein
MNEILAREEQSSDLVNHKDFEETADSRRFSAMM